MQYIIYGDHECRSVYLVKLLPGRLLKAGFFDDDCCRLLARALIARGADSVGARFVDPHADVSPMTDEADVKNYALLRSGWTMC